MRICLYTATALPKKGGQELAVDALAREFLRSQHSVFVLAPYPRSPIQIDDGRLPYPVIRHPRFYSRHRLVSWYRWFLLRLYRERGFHVLHCHGIYPPGYLAALCKKRLGMPLVITNHDGSVMDGAPRFTKPSFRPRFVKALSEADVLVAVSQFAQDGYQRLYPEIRRIVTIPNGVTVEDYAAPQLRPEGLDADIKEGGYILFLGRLKQRKGVDLLLDALAQIRSVPPPFLVIGGEGEEEGRLKDQAARLQLTDRIRFVGWVTGALKSYLLQNAICTVIPSRLPEAFGLVALESYAAGRPIVASSVPGLRELVCEDQTGLLVPPESSHSLGQALHEVLTHPVRAARLGEQARHYVHAYSWAAVARRHLELYEELLGRRPIDGKES